MLRVHVIPPLDGIYAQWDFNAGRMTRYYSSRTEATQPSGRRRRRPQRRGAGQHRRPVQHRIRPQRHELARPADRSTIRQTFLCDQTTWPYHQSVTCRPTLTDANAALGWSVSRPVRVDRRPHPHRPGPDLTPGGAAQEMVAEPVLRDDSCFDDGTGTDTGAESHLRSGRRACDRGRRHETAQMLEDVRRACRRAAITSTRARSARRAGHSAVPVDSTRTPDGALDEIVSSWGNGSCCPAGATAVPGERYGRSFEKPLVAVVLPYR